MEDWKKMIIINHKDKLVEATNCSYTLLTKLLSRGIINEKDFEMLVSFNFGF